MITHFLRKCKDVIKSSAPLQLLIHNDNFLPEDMHRHHQIILSTSPEHPQLSLTPLGHAQTSSNHHLHFSLASAMITYSLRTCTDIIKSSAPLQLSIQNDHLLPEDMHRHHQIISSTSAAQPE